MKISVLRLVSFLVPVGVGIGVLLLATSNRPAPDTAPATERARAVRLLTLEHTPYTPHVLGYGTVEPARTWDAVAQVQGRVEFVHPDLRNGALLREGTEIIRISPLDYEFAVAEAEANLAAAQAKLSELEVQSQNSAASLAIEKKSLALKQADFERQQGLLQRSAVSQASLDNTQRDLLSQQARVQDLENTIRLYPAQIESQRKQIDVNEAKRKAALLDLERTRIALPFNARISDKKVEETQFAAAGAVLASADDIGGAEVTVSIPQDQFREFVKLATPKDFRFGEASSTRGADLTECFGWKATVRLSASGTNASWPARIVRTADTIDVETRTVGAIVFVDEPYRNVQPGLRPPLVKGMFVQVELTGPPIADQLVAPRSAVRGGRVFVADAENRLRIKPVEVAAFQGDDALIATGLEPGDRIVLSDLSPAIEGMLLQPVAPLAPVEPVETNGATTSARRPVDAGAAP